MKKLRYSYSLFKFLCSAQVKTSLVAGASLAVLLSLLPPCLVILVSPGLEIQL